MAHQNLITSYYFPSNPKPASSQSTKRPRNVSDEPPPISKRPSQHEREQNSRKERLVRIADSTIEAMEAGSYRYETEEYDLSHPIYKTNKRTKFYSPNDPVLSTWLTTQPNPLPENAQTEVSILEISTMDGARLLRSESKNTIGILNFASATKPGGGFLNGASAQEESIARSSTLYASLITPEAEQFYDIHILHKIEKAAERKGKGNGTSTILKDEAYYTHAIIYSPGVLLMKDDAGHWTKPCKVDVLTSAAVNAGVVRRENKDAENPLDDERLEEEIESVMRERMARILFVFEQKQVQELVLGSFGTGVFRNKVSLVARIWAELLGVGIGQNAKGEGCHRFKNSFSKVVFAILGKETVEEFDAAFWGK